ncbi:MAG TPA: tetratricopeptide repeat protein [Pirellulales bacterium]|nr:tetratricopeptide repeat protein [Pirellulales bacterium]
MASPKSPKTPDAPAKSPLAARFGAVGLTAKRLLRWTWRHPLQAGIITGIVLLPVLPIVVVQITLSRSLPKEVPQPILDQAFAALDRKDYDQVAELVRDWGAEQPLAADELKAKPFLLGAVADHEADQMLGKHQRRLRALAAKYLTEARLLGFPPGREGEGLFLLGKNLYESGQAAESVSVLEEALTAVPARATELHRLLAGAYLDEPQPHLHEALQHNSAYLASADLPSDALQQALVERGRIEFELNEFDACRRTVDALPADSAYRTQITVLRALLLEQEARELAPEGALAANAAAVEKCRAAIDLLEKLPSRTASVQQSWADVDYLLGRLCLEIGEDDAGLAKLRRTQQRWAETDAGFAAGFLTADWYRRQRRIGDAMAAYRVTLAAVDAEIPFKNRWLSLDDLRTSDLDAYQELLRQQQFEAAIELAGLSAPIFSAPRSVQLQAQANAQWGRHLLAGAENARVPAAAEGRKRLRQAGFLYGRLAEMRLAAREYPDDLYDAAEADLAGHDYKSAVDMFRKYLSSESRKRRPRALLALGESLLALGQPADALKALEECIEFHARDAAVFEARLLAAQAYLEQGRSEPAEKLLLDNLYGDALSPASTEWRRSLFALGRLLYEAGRYPEAMQRLDEAIVRYPKDEEAEEARYLAAESYRRSAREVERQEQQEATAEGRLARRREWTQLLETGLARFEQELNSILLRQEQRPLTSLEEAILRNCFFSRGAILFQLGRYREAIQAYASVTNRYQQRPEVLQAYMQIAACYRRLGQTAEAHSTLEQAKYALKHLSDGVSFEDTSNYNRQEWGRLFETLGTL